jgi:hypothetical protein
MNIKIGNECNVCKINVDLENITDRLIKIENKVNAEIASIDHVLCKMSTDLYKHESFQDNLIEALTDFLALINNKRLKDADFLALINKNRLKDSTNEFLKDSINE